MKYILLALAGPLMIQVYDIIEPPERPDLQILLGVVLVLYYTVLALFLVFAVAVSFYGFYWKIVLSQIFALALVGDLMLPAYRIDFPYNYVHFLVVRSIYLDQMRQAGGNEPLFYAWLWERSWGLGSRWSQIILIYDETDQISLPPATRSTDWINRVSSFDKTGNFQLRSIYEPTLDSNRYDMPSIRKFADHFYLLEMAQ